MTRCLTVFLLLLLPGLGLCTGSQAWNRPRDTSGRVHASANARELELIADRIVDEIKSRISLDDAKVESYMKQLTPEGGFPDVRYKATDRTLWDPLKHLDRMLEMGLSYVSAESKFHADPLLKRRLDEMLAFWQMQQPRSNNWYQNEIAEPQRMGRYLLLMQRCGAEPIPGTLLDQSIERLRIRGGDPAKQAGANRVDVALHWLYRACLTEDPELLRTATDYIYSPVAYTRGAEGLQLDNSYTQHGRQLYIGQYGDAFLDGVTKASCHTVGTSVALSGEKLEILSRFVRDTYLGTIRGSDMAFNVIGRSSTRPDAVKKSHAATELMKRMILLDPAHAAEYREAIARLTGKKPAGYRIQPRSRYYYNSNYSIHIRPEYTMDLRFVSQRTVKNEQGIGNREAYKQYFLSDGATGIQVDGDEYENIFPVWDYTLIPGVTCPEVKRIPVDRSYITYGQTDIAGAVTDGLYNVSAYGYLDNRYGIATSARKAWFFFDREILCLGSGIRSRSEEKIRTTVNQCALDGSIHISANGQQRCVKRGRYLFPQSPEWILHDQVGYFFLQDNPVELEAADKTANWKEINGNYDKTVRRGVFTLSVNHGVRPSDQRYAYLIVPDLKTPGKARRYDTDKIEILMNTDSIQAVYHKELHILGVIFYRPGTFDRHGVRLRADAPSVFMLKQAESPDATLYVADIGLSGREIDFTVKIGSENERRLTYRVDRGYEGKTLCFPLR